MESEELGLVVAARSLKRGGVLGSLQTSLPIEGRTGRAFLSSPLELNRLAFAALERRFRMETRSPAS